MAHWHDSASYMVLIVLMVFLVAASYATCPDACDCKSGGGGGGGGGGGITVNCQHQQHRIFPENIPAEALKLDLSHNNLSSFKNLPPLPGLRTLCLDYNEFRGLVTGELNSLVLLQNLSVRHNRVSRLDTFTLTGLSSLRFVDFSYNQITSLPPLLAERSRLDHFLVTNNPLRKISRDTFLSADVKLLDLSSVAISSFDAQSLRPLASSLRILRLKNIRSNLTLTREVFRDFSLTELDLSDNSLGTDGSFLREVSVSTLVLDGNNVGALAVPELMKSVTRLSLRRASISRLGTSLLRSFPSLRFLDVSSNDLRQLDVSVFAETEFLTELRLAENKISRLPKRMAASLRRLEHLNLSRNALLHVEATSLEGLSLKTLDISYNFIQVLAEPIASQFEAIGKLRLQGNPLHCNCEMRWFRRWIGRFRSFHGADQCRTPRSVYIYELGEADFVCSGPSLLSVGGGGGGDRRVRSGADVLLLCVGGGDPAPEVEWKGPSGAVMRVTPPLDRMKKKTLAQWRILQIDNSMTGRYECRASSVNGNVTGSVVLTIASGPTAAPDAHARNATDPERPPPEDEVGGVEKVPSSAVKWLSALLVVAAVAAAFVVFAAVKIVRRRRRTGHYRCNRSDGSTSGIYPPFDFINYESFNRSPT